MKHRILRLFIIVVLSLSAILIYSVREQRGLFYNAAQRIGLVSEFDYISGTGSMYPTFPKGKGKTELERSREIVAKHKTRPYPGGIVIFGKRYFGYTLQRGDIVFFQNQATRDIIAKESSSSSDLNTGFVKRLIGLPGDTIEIRGGFVKINNNIIKEPYTAKAQSTYGGDFLPDCKPLTIPSDYVFVMGDNRKGSNDSRFDVGFVAFDDIKTTIPINEQEDLKNNWRDVSKDNESMNKPVFNVDEYLKLLNDKRREAKVAPLKYDNKLEQSAGIRANIIIKYDDLSFEATKSGYTMKKALEEAGYSNIVFGETPAFGYYESVELLDNYFEFPDTKKFLLKPEFTDTGIKAAVGEINGCPIQVVVQHLAGYVPPDYPKEAVDNWKKLIDNLNDVIPSWEKAKENQSVNQNELNKLLELFYERKNNAETIYSKMAKNLWLDKNEEEMVNGDNKLYEEIMVLVDKLNK